MHCRMLVRALRDHFLLYMYTGIEPNYAAHAWLARHYPCYGADSARGAGYYCSMPRPKAYDVVATRL